MDLGRVGIDRSAGAPILIGTEPGALLAGATLLFALRERGCEVGLATCCDDPLAVPLARALAARGIDAGLARLAAEDELPAGSIALGAGQLVSNRPLLGRLARCENALVALVGLGAEACAAIDPGAVQRALSTCFAEGALIERTLLRPFDPQVRAWLELVEDVHHAVGPAAQWPIVDTVRAALFGRQGAVAVNLAARERPAHVSLDSASIVWLDPRAIRSDRSA